MNYRQAKKRMYHQTMKHGGWKSYKDMMKREEFWNLHCESQKKVTKRIK